MQFSYTATNKTGEIIKGVLDAPDKLFAARLLRHDGNLPVAIAPVGGGASSFERIARGELKIFRRVSLGEKVLFAKNLSGMLSAGLSLVRALSVFERQTSNSFLKEIMSSLSQNISHGESLSVSMGKFPRIFSALFVSIVRAGEESGTLAASLREVSVHLERSYALRRKVRGAMTYPVLVITAMFGIGILMFIYVVPTLTQVFQDLNAELPWSTQIIISVSNFLKFHFLVFLGILVAVGLGFFYLLRLKTIQNILDGFILRLPVIGGIARAVNSARTARTLSTLITAGVSITQALAVTRDVVQNVRYKKVLEEAARVVEKGQSLSSILKQNNRLYPEMVGEMVEVGEETGNLSKMLSEVADFYEDEVDAKTKNLSTIIEPILMIVIGAAVGFFAVSMLSPMYSVLQNL